MTRPLRVTRPLRILLVEDNPGDADLTRDTLESGPRELEFAMVVDGEQAIDYLLRRGRHATAERPDVILLDLNLPRLGGVQVLGEIKRHDELRQIPVVVLTSSDAETDIHQAYRHGANAYVTKAGDLEGFMTNVQAIERYWFNIVKLP